MIHSASCAQVLRAIGQALEVLNLKDFELLNAGEDYLVLGDTASPPSSVALVLRYTLDDVDWLERRGQGRRRRWRGMPNPYSLSQMLRVVGSYIDHRGGRLLEVARRGQWVTIQYNTARGQRKQEEHLDSSIYDLSVQMFLHRERLRRLLLKSKPRTPRYLHVQSTPRSLKLK
jgi:hypothetical protein